MVAGLAMLVLALAALVMVLVAPSDGGDSNEPDRAERRQNAGHPVVGSPAGALTAIELTAQEAAGRRGTRSGEHFGVVPGRRRLPGPHTQPAQRGGQEVVVAQRETTVALRPNDEFYLMGRLPGRPRG